MKLPKDKLLHLKGGALVALAAAFIGYWLLWFGLDPLPAVLATTGVCVAASIEGTQWHDNRTAGGAHEVSLLDAVATAAPLLILSALVQIFA